MRRRLFFALVIVAVLLLALGGWLAKAGIEKAPLPGLSR
jgi:hypothetical protein